MTQGSNAAAWTNDVAEGTRALTGGVLAMINLQAQIDGREQQALAGRRAAVSDLTELIELVALRGQVLGRVTDYEWAEERAEQLTREAPADGAAFLARARARAGFHRFTDTLADLHEAHRLEADSDVVDAERAGVFQAIGRYEPALAIYNEATKRRADFGSLGALAPLHAEGRSAPRSSCLTRVGIATAEYRLSRWRSSTSSVA